MFPWFYFSITLFHAAAVILWIWRWRRDRIKAALVGQQEQHAYCASCGYDLTGCDVDRVEEVEATQCPECGRRIRAKGDVIIPKHLKGRMSHKLFAGMLGMQVIVFLMMGSIFINQYRNPSPLHATNAYLIKQVTQPGGASANSSDYFELRRRLQNGELSSSQEQQLITHALQIQADPSKPWERELGEMIESGRARGLVTDAQWRQYAKQPGVVQLKTRERINLGDPVVLRLTSDHAKLRASYDFGSQMAPSSIKGAKIAIYPENTGPDATPIVTHEMRLSSYHDGHFIPLQDGSSPLPVGPYKVVVDLNIPQPDPKQANARGGVFTPHQLAASFEVFPADQPQLIAVKDPALAQALQATIRDELLRTGGTRIKHETFGAFLSFRLKKPSTPLAGGFVVASPIDGFLNGTYFSFEPNVKGSVWEEKTIYLMQSVVKQVNNPNKPFEHFTLRFTPDPDRLKQQVDGYRYLDETLWIEDIPMGLPEP